MLKYIIALLSISTACYASAPKETNDTSLPAPMHQQMQTSQTQSYMLIPPAARAQDLLQAFEALKKEKTAAKLYFQLADGSILSGVIEMTPMSNSTLILFRLNTPQGIHLQIVKVEDILSINY